MAVASAAAPSGAPRIEIAYHRPPLYPKQEQAIFDPRRYSVIEASTKAGKTVGCLAWITEQALRGHVGANYWWVAPVYSQAQIAFTRLTQRLVRLLPAEAITINRTEQSVALGNGTKLWFKGSDKPDTLYGEDVYAAVIDEASRVKADAWYAVRSTLTATRGPIRLIGNVHGRHNWFYEMARRAEKAAADTADRYRSLMGFHRITALDAVEAGVLDREEIELAREDYPEDVYRELFFAEAADDAGNPFGLPAIAACLTPTWSDRRVEAWGWDLARKRDWTVGIGLDGRGWIAQIERTQQPWPEQVELIRRRSGTTPAFVDQTGVGDSVVGFLQRPMRAGGADWFAEDAAEPDLDAQAAAQQALRREFGGDTAIEGILFTPRMKQSLMEGLAVAIQHRQLRFPDEGLGHVLRLELESFEYTFTRTAVRYAAPEGQHDDTVCAAALAVRCLQDRGMTTLGTADLDLGTWVQELTRSSPWNHGLQPPTGPGRAESPRGGRGSGREDNPFDPGGQGGTWNVGF